VLDQEAMTEPESSVMPWERGELSFPRRVLGTMASAFAPVESVGSILSERAVAPALGFALLFAFPFMAAWAVIPFTHTLEFKPGAVLLVNAKAGSEQVALDVLRAAAIGLGMGLVSVASWALPFGSLLRAFCPRPDLAASAPRFAARLALYRAFLVPLALSLLYGGSWLLPTTPAVLFETAALLLTLMPRLILLMHTVALARALGLSGGARLAVVLVPVGVEAALGLLVGEGVARLLPPPPAG
jgi:hypothetical protein